MLDQCRFGKLGILIFTLVLISCTPSMTAAASPSRTVHGAPPPSADSVQQQLEEHEKKKKLTKPPTVTPSIPIHMSIPGMYWSKPAPQRTDTGAHRALIICCQHIVPDTTGQRSHGQAPKRLQLCWLHKGDLDIISTMFYIIADQRMVSICSSFLSLQLVISKHACLYMH